MNDGSEAAAASGPKIVIERSYRAKAEDLWALWTTKEGFESWWGPEGFRAAVHALDARIGGTLHYDMIADAPEQIAAMTRMGRSASHGVHARFTDFDPFRRLAITTVIDFVPGAKPYEWTLAVDFFVSGESVRMVVTLDPMHDEETARMSTMGLTSQLRKLEGRFGR